jgi:chromosome segregation ATPase
MIGCDTKNGVEYITKLEHFRDLMEPEVFCALLLFLENDKYQYQDRIDDLESELNSLQEDYDLLDSNYDDIDSELENVRIALEEITKKDLSKEEIIQELKKYIN